MFTVKTYAKGVFARRDAAGIDQITCVRDGDEWTYADGVQVVHSVLRSQVINLMLSDPEMRANGWTRSNLVTVEMRVIK